MEGGLEPPIGELQSPALASLATPPYKNLKQTTFTALSAQELCPGGFSPLYSVKGFEWRGPLYSKQMPCGTHRLAGEPKSSLVQSAYKKTREQEKQIKIFILTRCKRGSRVNSFVSIHLNI